ncbi:hypothetical protein ACQY0O_005015 [Thecaphora frezii]
MPSGFEADTTAVDSAPPPPSDQPTATAERPTNPSLPPRSDNDDGQHALAAAPPATSGGDADADADADADVGANGSLHHTRSGLEGYSESHPPHPSHLAHRENQHDGSNHQEGSSSSHSLGSLSSLSSSSIASSDMTSANPSVPQRSNDATASAGQVAPPYGARKRSGSAVSSSTVLSIPSRTSSVVQSANRPVPARSSSIASPLLRPGLPTSASDLADTIAELRLTDDADADDGDRSSGILAGRTPRLGSSPSHDAGGKTPLASSSAWGPKPNAAGGARHSVNGSSYGDDREEASLTETAEEIDDAYQAIEDIRRHIFVVQEKRHSGQFGADAADANGAHKNGDTHGAELPAGELDLALMQLDEKLEAVSRSMQQLEVRIGDICGHLHEQDGDSSIVDKEMQEWRSRQRRGSTASFGTLTSFDELMLPSFAPVLSPRVVRSRYDDLLADWTKVQGEADALRRELNDDKYIVVFRSVSDQAKSMMDSLDKAIACCQTFVSDFNRDYQEGLISSAADVDADDLGGERDPTARLTELAEVKKAFTVKKSYYTPACDQVFQVLERGTKERGASNGTIIRKLADLKSRWRQMRERVQRTEKNMKRIEAILLRIQAGQDGADAAAPAGIAFPMGGSSSMPSLPPAALSLRQMQPSTSAGQVGFGGGPGRPPLTPKSALRSTAVGSRVTSGPTRLSSSSSIGSSLSSTPPAPPPKSRLRRISATAEALGLQSQPISTPPRGSSKTFDSPRSLRSQRSQNFASAISASSKENATKHNRSNSAAFPENAAMKAWASARGKGIGSPPDVKRPLPNLGRPSTLSNRGLGDAGSVEAGAPSTPNRAPPSSYRSSWLGFDSAGAASPRSKTPQPQPSWSRSAANDPNAPPLPSQPARPSSRAGTSSRPGQARLDSDAGNGDGEGIEWIDNAKRAPARASNSDRPGSSLGGSYYRPPSAQGTVGDVKARRRDSMIPRLAVSSDRAGQLASTATSPARPGSSLSQASNGILMSSSHGHGLSNGSIHNGDAVAAVLTPPRYGGGASRLSMQTPEPTIMARAQRLSMYARAPSTGQAGMSTPGTPASKRNSRPPITRINPALMAGVRSASSGGGGNGRATPLSAAALASLPHADPSSSMMQRSSVANFRSSRGLGTSVAGGGGGRVTPTLSDAGSIGGLSNATWTGAGHRLGSGSVSGSAFGGEAGRGARIESYRPNPNDALDVEVAAIANGLGVSLERIDPPLPRGMKLEEGPGKDNRARYEVGGKEVMCRLLELVSGVAWRGVTCQMRPSSFDDQGKGGTLQLICPLCSFYPLFFFHSIDRRVRRVRGRGPRRKRFSSRWAEDGRIWSSGCSTG